MSMHCRAGRFRPHLLAAAVTGLLALPAAAETAADAGDDAPWTTEAVVVTALAPSAALTMETDPKQPRQPVPASDGADYLKTIPGFAVLRNGGTNGDPLLRGMFGSRLNLLTNDGTMMGACPARMDNALSYVAPETYDKLTVIKGPQSVIWGPGGSAGTVRFERRAESFADDAARGSVSALVGSWGRRDAVVDAAVGGPQAFARVTANRAESDDYEDGDGHRVPSRWYKWNSDATVGWTPNADTRLEATIGSGDGNARYAGRGMDGAQFRRDSAGLRLEQGGFSGALQSIQASAYYNYADHVMDNYSLREPDRSGPMPMPMASNVDRRTSGGRIATQWEWQSVALTVGADHQRNRHRERNGMGVDTYSALPWIPDARFSNTGVFAESTFALGPSQRVVAGARADRAAATDQRLTTGGMMPMPNPTAGRQRRETLGSGFVRYEQELAGAPFGWYAGIGTVERFPDYWELFSADLAAAAGVNPFSAVKPERTTQLDAGLQYAGTTTSAWVSLYAGRIDDFILFRYRGGGMMGMSSQVANVDARIHGGEAGLALRPGGGWKLQGTLAYAWGENRSDRRALPQMPPLEARFSADWAHAAWSFGGLWRVVAAQHRVAIDEGNVVGRDLGPGKGFGIVSANAGYRFSDAARLTAGIDNLFDRRYTEHLNLAGNAAFGYPADPLRINEPGRMLWTKLDLRF
jgi:iron complex outermembrane receptor protein